MKNIYLDVKANIENLQNIFKNTDNENERLKKSNQEALEVFQKLELKSLKELESLKNNEECNYLASSKLLNFLMLTF
ncbi:hypothetical protein [Helicobacter pylori]|uniref:hypothetical protein n=1 Tax=Helicobacter pylori TaxID=210 RepID=UPI001FBBB68C|nr:hypothetical protein [Helicobacter pylori]